MKARIRGTPRAIGTGLTAGKVKSGRREGVGASQRAARKRPARGPAAQPRKCVSTRCGHENEHENDSDTLCDDGRTGRHAGADRGEPFVRSNPNGSRGGHDRVSVLCTSGRGEARRAQVLLSQRGMTGHSSPVLWRKRHKHSNGRRTTSPVCQEPKSLRRKPGVPWSSYTLNWGVYP
jgi:hypothetical protein